MGQRTQSTNALHGHLAEFGLVIVQMPANFKFMVGMIDDDAIALLDAVSDIGRIIAPSSQKGIRS